MPMREQATPASYQPQLLAAVPAGIVKSAIVAAVITALAWLFIDQMNADLAGLTFAGLTLLFGVLTVGNLQAKEDEFHDDHVEVHEEFLTVTQDSVPYNRITDVSFSKSMWQRLFDVGTVRLNTAGSDTEELTLSYVVDAEGVYDDIAALVGEPSDT